MSVMRCSFNFIMNFYQKLPITKLTISLENQAKNRNKIIDRERIYKWCHKKLPWKLYQGEKCWSCQQQQQLYDYHPYISTLHIVYQDEEINSKLEQHINSKADKKKLTCPEIRQQQSELQMTLYPWKRKGLQGRTNKRTMIKYSWR